MELQTLAGRFVFAQRKQQKSNYKNMKSNIFRPAHCSGIHKLKLLADSIQFSVHDEAQINLHKSELRETKTQALQS